MFNEMRLDCRRVKGGRGSWGEVIGNGGAQRKRGRRGQESSTYLHADLGGPSFPGLGCPPRDLLEADDVRVSSQLR